MLSQLVMSIPFWKHSKLLVQHVNMRSKNCCVLDCVAREMLSKI